MIGEYRVFYDVLFACVQRTIALSNLSCDEKVLSD